jgi:hypothetical protein
MKIVLVHVVDAIQFEPETAQLAQLIVEEGGSPRLLLADYGTSDERFLGAFVEPPALALFRVTRQTLPMVQHMARALREQRPGLPIGFYGPLPSANLEVAQGILPDAWIFPGESEGPLRALARGEDERVPAGALRVRPSGLEVGAAAEALPADAFPNPHYGIFGGGDLFRRGIGASFFGETFALPFEFSVGGEAAPPANAALASFSRYLDRPLALRSPELVADRMKHAFQDFSVLRRVEIRDRAAFGDREAALALCEVLRRAEISFDLRFDETRAEAALFAELSRLGARRLVLELDAAPGEETPAGLRDPEQVAAAARLAREAGLEVGLLASFGLPGETPATLDRKLDFLRALQPARLRMFPFEPRFAHPIYAHCEAAGIMPSGENAWNREVYHPLEQAGMPEEAWYLAWQRALNLQAEVEVAQRRAEGVA